MKPDKRHIVTDIQPRFSDFDMFGHLNNTVYLEYFDLGKVDFFGAVLGPDFGSGPIVPVVVNINCDFMAQTRPGEPIRVLTSLEYIGESSLHLKQRVLHAATGEVKCRCATVMVLADVAAATSVVVPDDWRQQLQQWLQPK